MKLFSNNEYADFLIKHFKELSFVVEFDDVQKQKCIYIDRDLVAPNIVEKNIKMIDSFPKLMAINSPHSVLEVFHTTDLDESKRNEYLRQEKQFLRTILLIASYSQNVVVSTNYLFYKTQQNYPFIDLIINREDIEIIEQNIHANIFALYDAKGEYFFLSSLLKMTFTDQINTILCMPDLDIVIDIKGLAAMIYAKNNNWEFIERICMTEGLYLR